MSAPGVQMLRANPVEPVLVLDDDPEAKQRRETPARVWLHNDDVTPAEYVVTLLQQVFALGWWKANWIMLRAHATGQSIVGVYPREEAEQKVAATVQRARGDGWPLRLSVEHEPAQG